MKAALPKRRSFICNYQRLTYHLPTFSTHKRYVGNPFICTKENKTNYRKMIRKPLSHVRILTQYIERGLLTVAVLTLTSLADCALVLETKFVSPVTHLNNKNDVCKQ